MANKKSVSGQSPPGDAAKLETGFWEPEFWLGYRRGLNRRLHGKIFGDEEEHHRWHDMPDNLEEEPSIELVARGMGYRAGFAGIDSEQAAGKLRDFMKILVEKYRSNEEKTS